MHFGTTYSTTHCTVCSATVCMLETLQHLSQDFFILLLCKVFNGITLALTHMLVLHPLSHLLYDEYTVQ